MIVEEYLLDLEEKLNELALEQSKTPKYKATAYRPAILSSPITPSSSYVRHAFVSKGSTRGSRSSSRGKSNAPSCQARISMQPLPFVAMLCRSGHLHECMPLLSCMHDHATM